MMTKRKTTKNGFALRRVFVVVALCVITLSTVGTAFATAPTVTTGSGVLIGKKALGMNEFLGIPYALPPVDGLRWMPPVPYGTLPTNPFHATQFGNICSQAIGGAPAGSENCLFLNVFTPATGGSGLPVMVWIHGGGLIEGASNSYNPQWLVKNGVIVVTLNYRLGYMGFFAQTSIDAEGHENGNYGLMDQQLALQWVQNNIAAFGGDPTHVTIFGQSAGGQSVYAHLASPTATGLFQGAIAESGSYEEFQPYLDYVVPEATGETVGGPAVPSGDYIALHVGCGAPPASSACLRAVPAAYFLPQLVFPMFPYVDGTLLTQTITNAIFTGTFPNKVPVITGSNTNEYNLFVAESFDFNPLSGPIANSAEYTAAVNGLFPAALAPFVLAVYSYGAYPSGDQALGTAATDGGFSCPEWNVAQALSLSTPTYAYEFADQNAPPAQADFGGALTFPLGAYHAAEVQYLFRGFDLFGLPIPTPLSAPQTRLSKTMLAYWTQFAKTGNPNVSPRPNWPAYNVSTNLFQSLIEPAPVPISSFGTEHLCPLLWDNPAL